MKRWIIRLLRNEAGTAPIEYAMIATLVSIIAISSMTAIGGSVNSYLNAASSAFAR
jgi:Flp pilus assembly pilin Flp